MIIPAEMCKITISGAMKYIIFRRDFLCADKACVIITLWLYECPLKVIFTQTQEPVNVEGKLKEKNGFARSYWTTIFLIILIT